MPNAPRRTDLVSIIVPVYNAGGRLDDCVASILAQDHERIEVILIDDGSDDGSGAACDRWAERDQRVTAVHQLNGGISAAQNAGLDRATGDFITFCDNDDIVSPRLVARLLDILLDADADMSMCRWTSAGPSTADAVVRAGVGQPAGAVEVFDDPGRWYQSVFSLAHRRAARRELRYFSEANWGKLYRAELFDGIRFPEGHYAQDVAVAMDLYLRMRRVASCADALYVWVQHPQSVSHRERRTRYFDDIVRAHGRCFELALAAGITPARAYGGMMTLGLERRSVRDDADAELYREDRSYVRERVRMLSVRQRLVCSLLHRVRRLENIVYRLTIHRRR